MVEIKNADTAPEDYEVYKRWTAEEWREPETSQSEKSESQTVPIPSPLLAYEDSILAGGLSFIKYKNPETAGEALWINSVFVNEKYRCRNIAKALIKRAQLLAINSGSDTLYAYTDKPRLYTKCGWSELKSDEGHFIMKYKFTGASAVSILNI